MGRSGGGGLGIRRLLPRCLRPVCGRSPHLPTNPDAVNILLLLAHSIAEYDDLRMLSDLGYDVFSIGAYIDPAHPSDDKRPPLPGVRSHPELAALVGDQMEAKEHLPDEIIEWADTII